MNAPARHLTFTDALADAGSRPLPYYLLTTSEGDVIERLQVEDTTIREHANRAACWSRLSHDWEFDDNGRIVAATTANEITRVEP